MLDNMTGTQELIFAVIAPLILLGALVYAIMRNRRRTAASKLVADAATRRVYREEDRKEKAASGETAGDPALVPDAGLSPDRRMTEDEMQQRALGGVKGSPNLKAASLTDKERLNTFS